MIGSSKKEELSLGESKIKTAQKEESEDASMNIDDSNQIIRESIMATKFDKISKHGDLTEPVGAVEDLKDDEIRYDRGISIFLQHSLNVWHVVNHDLSSLSDALCGLLESTTGLPEEEWLVYSACNGV